MGSWKGRKAWNSFTKVSRILCVSSFLFMSLTGTCPRRIIWNLHKCQHISNYLGSGPNITIIFEIIVFEGIFHVDYIECALNSNMTKKGTMNKRCSTFHMSAFHFRLKNSSQEIPFVFLLPLSSLWYIVTSSQSVLWRPFHRLLFSPWLSGWLWKPETIKSSFSCLFPLTWCTDHSNWKYFPCYFSTKRLRLIISSLPMTVFSEQLNSRHTLFEHVPISMNKMQSLCRF